MCMSTPKAPKVKDPVLPPQPIQRQEPIGLKVGRTEAEDTKVIQKNRARRKLRIGRDRVSTQTTGSSVGLASGVQGGGM